MMNQVVLQAMEERRSCRRYLPEQIGDEELNAVLRAGEFAPSGMGRQSQLFLVLQDPDEIRALSEMNGSVMGSPDDPFYGAPTVIVVFADSSCHTWVEDGSLAMGNLLLAAHAAGLGSCWIHRAYEVFESPEGQELKKKYGIPPQYKGVGNCILGYEAEGGTHAAKERKAGRIIRR